MTESSAETTSQSTKKLPWRNVCCRCGKVEEGEIEVLPDSKLNPLNTDSLCTDCYAAQQADWALAIERKRQEIRERAKLDMHKIPEDLLYWDTRLGNRALANTIKSNRDKCLFICGGYGTGKTRAAAANLARLADNHAVRFYRWSDLARQYAELCKSESEKSSEFIKELAQWEVLLIDDIGKKRLTENASELLFDLLDKVYLGQSRCRIWLTCNKDLLGVKRLFVNPDVGNAFVSRIDRMIDEGKLVKIEAAQCE